MIRPCIRMVFIFILMMTVCQSWAGTYDPLLLRAQASIFPKIVLLDQDLDKKTPGDEVVITIVSTALDPHIAQQLRKSIEDKYRGRLGSKSLTVNVTTFEEFSPNTLATAYIVLHGSESLIEKVVSYASSHERIVFSYSYSSFIYKALVSLNVKEKTYVYLNKSAIQLYNIRFFPVFYNIAKII